LEENGNKITSYEIKLSATLNDSMFKGLNFYKKLNPSNNKSFLVYNGNRRTRMYGHICLPYTNLEE